MAVTVAEIIQGARDHHASLDPHAHPDSIFIRWIDRYHKRLVGKVIQINPDQICLFQTITLPLSDFDAGEAAVAAHHYLSGKAFFRNTTDLWDRLEKIRWESRGRHVHAPVYSIVNDTIRLHGVAADWTQYSSLELRYIPQTTILDDDTDPIILPDAALDCMTLGAAHFAMRRQPEQPFRYKTYFAELRAEWLEAERTFLGEIAAVKQTELSQVNEIW